MLATISPILLQAELFSQDRRHPDVERSARRSTPVGFRAIATRRGRFLERLPTLLKKILMVTLRLSLI
jgi:hypothetical protein